MRPKGFEPPTFCWQLLCSIRLNLNHTDSLNFNDMLHDLQQYPHLCRSRKVLKFCKPCDKRGIFSRNTTANHTLMFDSPRPFKRLSDTIPRAYFLNALNCNIEQAKRRTPPTCKQQAGANHSATSKRHRLQATMTHPTPGGHPA